MYSKKKRLTYNNLKQEKNHEASIYYSMFYELYRFVDW